MSGAVSREATDVSAADDVIDERAVKVQKQEALRKATDRLRTSVDELFATNVESTY